MYVALISYFASFFSSFSKVNKFEKEMIV